MELHKPSICLFNSTSKGPHLDSELLELQRGNLLLEREKLKLEIQILQMKLAKMRQGDEEQQVLQYLPRRQPTSSCKMLWDHDTLFDVSGWGQRTRLQVKSGSPQAEGDKIVYFNTILLNLRPMSQLQLSTITSTSWVVKQGRTTFTSDKSNFMETFHDQLIFFLQVFNIFILRL